MKKILMLAIFISLLNGCYTPINNSGVTTNKPWLDVSTTRVDFDGQQYDSCVQFNIRFWPQEAAERINLSKSCISACCWRSEQNEIVLDFNKNFEKELASKGYARKYFPEKVTLKVTHSNFVNLTKVKVSPQGAISNNGLLKLTYQEFDNPVRIAQLQQQRQVPVLPTNTVVPKTATPVRRTRKQRTTTISTTPSEQSEQAVSTVASTEETVTKTTDLSEAEKAKKILQQQVGTQIDAYFYQMNKTYRNQNAIFMLSDRLLQASTYGSGIYLITCHAKARTGVDSSHLNSSDFPCGKWLVDVSKERVTPYNTKARDIDNNY